VLKTKGNEVPLPCLRSSLCSLYPVLMVTLATVWQTGLTFPNVEKGTAYGNPALKVGGKLMAAVPQ
jgi:hypothetical protein